MSNSNRARVRDNRHSQMSIGALQDVYQVVETGETMTNAECRMQNQFRMTHDE
jgi:hypothetical protein